MKIIYHGQMFDGSKARQRAEAMAALPDTEVLFSDSLRPRTKLRERVLEKIARSLARPVDFDRENEHLLTLARENRPDAILADKGVLIRAETLCRIKEETGAVTAFLSTDDILTKPYPCTVWVRETLSLWDIIFTPKPYGAAELANAGARKPILFGNTFASDLHRPLTPEEVGPDYESFDVVFVGTYEPERARSLVTMAKAGFSIVVYGGAAGMVEGSWARVRHSGIALRPAAYGEEYVKACHHGKIALGFLRKKQRDTITSRSIELPAMGRPMLAEWSRDHDAHFQNGVEYLSFRNDEELIEKARDLLNDDDRRRQLAAAGRRRCLSSRYDSDALAEFLVGSMRAERAAQLSAERPSASG